MVSRRGFVKSAAAFAVVATVASPKAFAQGTLTLNGAGASFPNPLYSKAFAEYTKLHPEVQINYQSVGSSAGVEQLTAKTVDFGASDAPMNDEQLEKVGGKDKVVHIPATMGAVAITYNLPSLKEGLNLDAETIAGIFGSTITKWNDDKIKGLNEGVELPDTDIAMVHRSDGSGTTNIFTTYLSNSNEEWKNTLGAGNSVEWKGGVGAKGNEGVAGQIKMIEGGVGYVELAYAHQNNLAVANVQNSAGEFVTPSAEGATACAAAVAGDMDDTLTQKIAGCTGDDAAIYPISGYTWLIVYSEAADEARGKATLEVINWLITDGQQYGAELDYAPLPEDVVKKAQARLATVTFNGTPLMPELGGDASPVASPAASPKA